MLVLANIYFGVLQIIRKLILLIVYCEKKRYEDEKSTALDQVAF